MIANMRASMENVSPGLPKRIGVLDGWRALSIILVLGAHMLPLGPRFSDMNEAIGVNGMAIFFTLSGFLIISILLRDQEVTPFLIRRLTRILPLALPVLIVTLFLKSASCATWLSNLTFTANLPPFFLIDWTSHYWSLDVEIQFYFGIAAVVFAFGRRGLLLVPIAAFAVTATRVFMGIESSIVTWFRVDEILAGGTLALIIQSNKPTIVVRLITMLPFWPTAVLFLLSARHEFLPLEYARPYLAAAMIGVTIVRAQAPVTQLLECRQARYLAKISYAVYIIHHLTIFGWLNEGSGVIKYAKRPISFIATFILAHLSTVYFERHFIRWGHRLTKREVIKVKTG